MPISDWPDAERPREKLLLQGAKALSDAELLAIFLRTGLPGQTAVDIARSLLGRFENLRGLLDSDIDTLCREPGFGRAKYALLQAALELGQRHLHQRLTREDVLKSPEATHQDLSSRLRRYPQEVFACLYLDTRNRVIRYAELFHGTIDGAAVHPREVVREALACNAAAVILAHNHPSGVAEPSSADRAITRRLVDALGLIDVRVLDHIVIGDGESVSFARRGWI